MIAHLCLSLLHLCAHEQPNQWGAQTLLKRSTVGSVSTEAEKAHLCQKLQNLFWNHQPGHCGLVMCWVGRPNQTVKDITTRHAIPPKLVVSVYTSGGGGSPRAGTYPCRWCRFQRSLACRCTGVLEWCWCRLHCRRMSSDYWRTHRAL